jgi:hypothetical protein
MLTSRPDRLTPEKVGDGVGRDVLEKRYLLPLPTEILTPDRPVRSLDAIPTPLPRLLRCKKFAQNCLRCEPNRNRSFGRPGVDGTVTLRATGNLCGCGLDPSGPKKGLVVG